MRIALTAHGIRFLLLLGIVGFAAYNNQNNLLYLMASAGLASVLVCAVAGWSSLRGIRFVGAESPDAYTDVPFKEKLLLTSTGRAFNAFGLEIEEGKDSISFLKAGARGACRVERVYRRRGRYVGEPVSVATDFPFGFFRVRRKLPAARDVLVFPRIRPIDTALLHASGGGSLARTQRRGQGDEFFTLREYVPGDHIHHIHWRTSAKLNGMMVREFGEIEEERLCVGFVAVSTDSEDTSEFEHLVSAAASLVSHLTKTGVRFRFLADALDLAPSSSREHARLVLTYLAEVQPARELDLRFVANARNAEARGETVLVVSVSSALDVGTVLRPEELLRPTG